MMDASALALIMNVFLLLISVAQLALSGSIFDFIVVHRMFYTVPDQNVLLDSSIAVWFYVSAVLVLLLSAGIFGCTQAPQCAHNLAIKHSFIISLLHAIFLAAVSALCAFCSLQAATNAAAVGQFAFYAQPEAFQNAAHWYFVRLRASSVLWGLAALLNLATLGVLYLGIKCRQRAFTQLTAKISDY